LVFRIGLQNTKELVFRNTIDSEYKRIGLQNTIDSEYKRIGLQNRKELVFRIQ
jgi:hypothetical protein